jgi:hypothetical protein
VEIGGLLILKLLKLFKKSKSLDPNPRVPFGMPLCLNRLRRRDIKKLNFVGTVRRIICNHSSGLR